MFPFQQIARRLPIISIATTSQLTASRRHLSLSSKSSSDIKPDTSKPVKDKDLTSSAKASEEVKPMKKTQAELDQELLLKLQGIAGDGGDAGVEYEDGKPVAMKRSVKNNMFRYI